MKFKILDKNSFIIYLNNFYKKKVNSNSKEVIKDILLLIKKRYDYNIFGYYEVNIYRVKDLLTILLFKRIDNDNMLYNSIDLKIIEHKKMIDYSVNDFYINCDKSNNIYKICEHYSINEVNLHR